MRDVYGRVDEWWTEWVDENIHLRRVVVRIDDSTMAKTLIHTASNT